MSRNAKSCSSQGLSARQAEEVGVARKNTMPGGGDAIVLIVGAGPTGLTMGTELVRRGVSVRLVEKLPAPVKASRAFTLHSRTLEALDVMGIREKVEEYGVKATAMVYHFINGEGSETKNLRLNFDKSIISGRRPWVRSISQVATEKVLRDAFENAGGVVEWGVELKGFEEVHGLVKATLDVRKLQGVEFAGLEYTGQTLKIMDVSLNGTFDENNFDYDAYHYFIKQKSMVLFIKIGVCPEYPSENDVWRLVVSTTEENPDVRPSAFQDAVDAMLDGVVLGPPLWKSAFRVQKRMVSTYISEQGRVLLAGDSAHINSPAGGQGLNTAIQDAFNLGWKLAMVCEGRASPSLLGLYEVERKPIAKRVLEGTHLLHSVVMAHGKGLGERMELAASEKWTDKAVATMSGNAYSYCDDQCMKLGNDFVVRPGEHAPDVLVTLLETPGSLHRLSCVPVPYFVLVSFNGLLVNEAKRLERKYAKGILTVVQAAPCEDCGDARNGGLVPMESILRAQYGTCSFALVRPDKYVAGIFYEGDDVDEALESSMTALGVWTCATS